jgi:hypothetical protein
MQPQRYCYGHEATVSNYQASKKSFAQATPTQSDCPHKHRTFSRPRTLVGVGSICEHNIKNRHNHNIVKAAACCAHTHRIHTDVDRLTRTHHM